MMLIPLYFMMLVIGVVDEVIGIVEELKCDRGNISR